MTDMRIEKQWCHGLVLVLWLAVSAGAHVGDRVYPVSYLSDEMLEQIDLRDGLADEWQELVGEPAMTLLDFHSIADPDRSDFDFRIWLAWHDDPPRFYVAFVSSDDVYKNTHNYDVVDYMGLNDSISLVIDGDHSGGAGCSAKSSIAPGHQRKRFVSTLRNTTPSPSPLMARTWMTRSQGKGRGSFPGRSCPPTGTQAAACSEKTRPSASSSCTSPRSTAGRTTTSRGALPAI